MTGSGVRTRVTTTSLWLVVALLCIAVAGTLTGVLSPPPPLNLSPELLVLGLVFAAAVPLLLHRWRSTFWILLGWFMVEDLIRKYLGNDIRVYFMKDAVFILMIAGMLVDPAVRGAWRTATGSARYWLYAMIAWSLVLSVPMAFTDWRIPLVAMKLDWQYVPLVAAAFVMARQEGGFRRLLTGFVALSIPVCIIGVVQGSIGPSFLRPVVETPRLDLILIRANDVFQPTGPFADGGRFGYTAMLSFVMSLALLVLSYRDSSVAFRVFTLVGLVSAGAAVWVHASRTNIVIAPIFIAIAALAPSFAERRPATLRAVATLALVGGLLLAIFVVLPTLSSNRVAYFRDSLDPSAETNQWDLRASGWLDNAARGVRIGGVIGAGTGAGSLGLQYLSSVGAPEFETGVEQIEGGYAAVVQQWGLIGLVTWLGWTLSWVARSWRAIGSARGHPEAGAGLMLCAWIVVYLFVGFVAGFQGFQNYITNAYLWILFGMLFALPRKARISRHADDLTRTA